MVGHCDNVLDVFGARCELRRSDDGTLRHAAHQPDGWQRPNAIDLSPVSHIGTEHTLYCVVACKAPLHDIGHNFMINRVERGAQV